jgi:hypothetical protein
MRIVSAGMRDTDLMPGGIRRGAGRGVRKTRVFTYRQRIHICSCKYCLSLTVAQDADDTSATNLFMHFVTAFSEFRCHECGGSGFRKAKLGMGMEILVNKVLSCGSGLETSQDVGD